MKEFINKIKNNKTILAIIIAVLLITITGTFAWLSWKSKETALVLKVGDINGTIVTLKPYQLEGTLSPVQSYTDGLYTDVNITNNSTSNVYNVKLYYNISAIDDALKSEDFKYTILNTATNETTEGNFLNATTTDKFIIFDKDITPKDISNYKIYIWISGEGDTTSLQGKSFKAELRADIVFNKESSTKNIVVDVPEGMIPIVFDTSNGTVVKTVSSSDSSWYDYSNQEWANAVLVKENGTQTRAYYKANSGVEVNQADILAYYVWIPRYKYKIWETGTSAAGKEQGIEIEFETKDTEKSVGTQVGEYRTHPAFTFGDTELSGIWVGKFETTGIEDSPTILPDVSSLRSQNVSTQFATAQKFGTSTYGSTSNIDAHMMKNSEWGAVAYLSHSKYGANREIYINNSSSYYTGRSGGNVGGSTAINTVYTDQTSTTQYNSYGFYTWDGFLLNYNTNTKSSTRDLTKVGSTTGNMTGVYDMSGGASEYVMGWYSGASDTFGAASSNNNAKFTSAPDSKYWDEYTTTDALTACNDGICYGHGLSEVNKWYGDLAYFVSAKGPWLGRGGRHYNGASAGAFGFSSSSGYAYDNAGFRSVLSFVGA